MAFLTDGHPTTIELANLPADAKFCEKVVQPPGIDGGGENDTTTMKNVKWRTKQPKKLKTLTPMNTTVSYDPEVLTEAKIAGQINVNQIITVTFSDGSKLAFWGWVNTFAPGDSEEGSQPEAEMEIIPSNQDNNNVEQDPVFTPAP